MPLSLIPVSIIATITFSLWFVFSLVRQQDTPQGKQIEGQATPARPREWPFGRLGIASVVVLLALYFGTRNSALRSELTRCDSHGVVNVTPSYAGIVGTDTVVFDLRDGGEVGARRVDAAHLLMQFASRLDLYSIRRVVLARNGEERFYVDSADLRPLADSYSASGRGWALFNLPSCVRNTNGTDAFGKWTGGAIGVLKEQAEDLNDFLAAWLD